MTQYIDQINDILSPFPFLRLKLSLFATKKFLSGFRRDWTKYSWTKAKIEALTVNR